MNILYLCDEYPPGRHGGIGTAVQVLAHELVKQGHMVVVAGFYDWGYGGEDEFTDNGVKVYRFRRRLASRWFDNPESLKVRATNKMLKASGVFQKDIESSLKRYGKFLNKLLEQYSIDIIEMPDYNDYMRFCNDYVPFPKLNGPVVEKLHGGMTYFAKEANTAAPKHIQKMEHDLLQNSAAVISVSNYTAEKTAKYFDYKKKITTIYNGIDTSLYSATANKDALCVIFTGTLIEKKGIYQLMKAWNIVNEKMPVATLHVYGKGPADKVGALLAPAATGSVIFKGHTKRDELLKHIASVAVAVFPSYAEAFSLAPMEAMVCGTATIYSTRTSGRELIDNGVNGILVDPDDVENMAEQIITLLTDKILQQKLATAGRKHIEEKFELSAIAQQHIDLYRSVIAERS